MPVMLQIAETKERRSTPTTGKAAQPILDAERQDDAARQHKPEPSRGNARCLWCQRAFTPRMTGGSPQRFCSAGHRQAFWIAARRWTMRAVEVGLINIDCLKTYHPRPQISGR